MLHHKLISRLNATYQYAVTNEHSSLYRDVYGTDRADNIHTQSDWEALPILTKQHIASYPYETRLFTSRDKVIINRVSSGTSASAPLVYPRSMISSRNSIYTCTDMPVCTLNFFTPQYMSNYVRDEVGAHTIAIAADLHNLAGSVALALACKLNHITASISNLQLLAPYLEERNALSTITHIELSGERISDTQKEWLFSTFPNAHTGMLFALTETQGIVGVCSDIRNEIMYAVVPGFYIEQCDGELLITHTNVHNNCFPLLRYNTRDTVEIQEEAGQQYFKIIGRSALDTIKIPGGVIMTSQVEAALYRLHPHLTGEFELHYSSTPKPTVEIKIQKRHTMPADEPAMHMLCETVAKKLNVSPTYTYHDGVYDKIYNPLTITLVDKLEQTTAKKVRLFVH